MSMEALLVAYNPRAYIVNTTYMSRGALNT